MLTHTSNTMRSILAEHLYFNKVLFVPSDLRPFCYLETVQRHTKTIKNKCKVYSINSNNSEWFTSSYQ
ncbi:hypothetical protein QE152_g23785 [Popillia japonica]|uniref:Uncharacterized protein n=1 Tax=Popillia japonica TaxID=7064 RepID=A0AAW1KFF4_POPJA